MSLEAYSVAVRLSLINHVSPALVAISRHFAATDKDAKNLQAQLNKIKLLGAAGAAIGGAGFMGLGLIAKTIKPASEYAHQLALMNTAGMKHLEIINATKAAWEATKTVPTESVTSNLETIRDLRMVFGNTLHAIEYMPALQKVQGLLGTLRHGQPGAARAESYELAKALEMKGAVKNPAMFMTQADLMTKALVASGGKVNATDFLSAFKYGRAATSGWNDDFTYRILPTLIQEMKGGGGSATGGPGSALMSAYAAVVGGVVPQKALKVWDQLHMLDPSKVVWTKVHEAKGLRPGGILGSEAFQQNPYAWAQSHLIPALQKAGYLTEAQQKQALQYLFPNRTAGFVMSQFVTQAWKFERDRKLIEGASGLAGYDELLKNDPMMARMALEKQWESLLAILGYRIMPQVLSGTLKLMEGLRGLSEWSSRHSTTTKTLMWSFIGLSAAMAFSGTVMMLTAGFKGLALVLPLLKISSLVTSLTGPAGLIAALTGPAGLMVAVGAVGLGIGAFIGTIINHGINGIVSWLTGGKESSVGGWIYSLTHNNLADDFEDRRWRELYEKNHPNVTHGKATQPVHATINLQVDGQTMATKVIRHLERGMSQPQGGSSFADALMSTPSPANPY